MRPHILIVEDHSAAATVMALLLRAEGYDADCVADGRAAVNYLRCRPTPALVLLDLLMPVMDGWEFLQARGQDRDLAAAPVVVLTGAGRAYRDPALAMGADDFLEKPVAPEELLDVVRRYCPLPVS